MATVAEAPADLKLHEPTELAVALPAPAPEHLEEIAELNETNEVPEMQQDGTP